jgi:hypothetical protein
MVSNNQETMGIQLTLVVVAVMVATTITLITQLHAEQVLLALGLGLVAMLRHARRSPQA